MSDVTKALDIVCKLRASMDLAEWGTYAAAMLGLLAVDAPSATMDAACHVGAAFFPGRATREEVDDV